MVESRARGEAGRLTLLTSPQPMTIDIVDPVAKPSLKGAVSSVKRRWWLSRSNTAAAQTERDIVQSDVSLPRKREVSRPPTPDNLQTVINVSCIFQCKQHRLYSVIDVLYVLVDGNSVAQPSVALLTMNLPDHLTTVCVVDKD